MIDRRNLKMNSQIDFTQKKRKKLWLPWKDLQRHGFHSFSIPHIDILFECVFYIPVVRLINLTKARYWS